VGVGEGLGVAVGVAEAVAVQSTVPVSQGPGGGRDILNTPAATPSVGNEPLTVVSKMVCVNPWVTGSISIGKGNPKLTEHVRESFETSAAVKASTFVPSRETVRFTVPQGGLAQPVTCPV
jgi:hypothetical protein